MNEHASPEGQSPPEQQDSGQQLETAQLEQLYRVWREEVYTGGPAPDLKQLVAEADHNPAAQDKLVSELSGHLALIALNSETESPLAAYNYAQAAALERAKTISPKLSRTGILDGLLDAAIESAEPSKASRRPANDPRVTDIKNYRNREAAPEDIDEYDPRLGRMVTILQSREPGDRDREEAFTAIFRRYSPMLSAYIYHMTGSRQAVQDILQEVFLMVDQDVENLEYRGQKAFKSWLYTIAFRRTLNMMRTLPYKAGKTTMPLDEDLALANGMTIPAGISATEQRESPETSLEQKETIRELREVLNGLLPHEKTAIILYGEGWSYEQISIELGKTVSSVKSFLVRGRVKLNTRMEERLNPSLDDESPENTDDE